MNMEKMLQSESVDLSSFEGLTGGERPFSPLSRALTDDALARAIEDLENGR